MGRLGRIMAEVARELEHSTADGKRLLSLRTLGTSAWDRSFPGLRVDVIEDLPEHDLDLALVLNGHLGQNVSCAVDRTKAGRGCAGKKNSTAASRTMVTQHQTAGPDLENRAGLGGSCYFERLSGHGDVLVLLRVLELLDLEPLLVLNDRTLR